ncbi:MAG: helix-turn-helix domain-containing protein [Gemmatimonadaceae bacterium]
MSDHSHPLRAGFCPRYHYAIELMGRRWTGAIIRALLGGRARYNELRSAIPDISDRMLSERLRELEAEEIVVRTVLPESPIRVEYELTERGRALETAVAAIAAWAEEWVPASAVESGGDAVDAAEGRGRADNRRALSRPARPPAAAGSS